MKTFSKLLSEVAQPKAGDEIHFKAKHEIEKLPHSHAGDETFKGSTKKMPKRRADYEKGNDEDVYEALDPVGKADADIDNDGDVDSSDKYLHARRKAIGKAIKKRKMKEEIDLDEAKADIYHKHMLKALGKSRLPKNHQYTSAVATNGDFVVHDGGGRVVGRIKKGDHNLKEEAEQLDEIGNTPAGKKKLKNLIVNRTQKVVDAGASLERRPEKAAEYDKAQKRHMKTIGRAATRLAKESVEQLDELSPNTLHSYIKGAGKDLAKRSRMSGYDDKRGNYADGDKNRKKANKRLAGITSASGRLADKANMAEDAWEEIPMMSRQLQFVMYAAQEIMSYLNDCDDMCVDPEEWFQNKLAHVHGQMMTLHGYVEGDRRMNMSVYGEEVELDEVSKDLLGRYAAKAHNRGDMAARMSKSGRDKDMANIANKRYYGVKNAINKLSGRARVNATEEVELDEVTDQERLSARKIQRDAQTARHVIARKPGESMIKYLTRAEKHKKKMQKEEVELDEGIHRAGDRVTWRDHSSGKNLTGTVHNANGGRMKGGSLAVVKVDGTHMGSTAKIPHKQLSKLDEVTRSAIKRPVKYTDARGVTRTRMSTTRPVQHDEYGQEKMSESLQEAVKPGKLKLDDGSSITVSKKDAELLNQMFNDLNKANRKKMQDTMMSDKAGYEEIVGFAREAL